MDKDTGSGIVSHMSEVAEVGIVAAEVNAQALMEVGQVCRSLTLAPLGENCGDS